LHVVGFALPTLIYDLNRPFTVRALIENLADRLRGVLLRQADHVVVETGTVRRRLARRLRIDCARISVIGNGVNPLLSRFEGAESQPVGRFGILIPSAPYAHKNLAVVPRVATAMRRQDPDLDFEFRFTLDPAGPAWQALAADADQFGVADRLITLGILPLELLASAYRAASVVFLPTLLEASTAVYPESFFFRRPLVTSDMDFARELCGSAALYVPPLEAEQTAARLVELTRSSSLRARLIEAGERQLSTYPSPKEKFAMQMEMLASLVHGSSGAER
jgi:glycosyltransferase involved in cell wall biosynthesis